MHADGSSQPSSQPSSQRRRRMQTAAAAGAATVPAAHAPAEDQTPVCDWPLVGAITLRSCGSEHRRTADTAAHKRPQPARPSAPSPAHTTFSHSTGRERVQHEPTMAGQSAPRASASLCAPAGQSAAAAAQSRSTSPPTARRRRALPVPVMAACARERGRAAYAGHARLSGVCASSGLCCRAALLRCCAAVLLRVCTVHCAAAAVRACSMRRVRLCCAVCTALVGACRCCCAAGGPA